jgi:hypothetical protein
MIAVRLEGRLGNQLFQYAFIYSAAKRLNTSFYLDKSVDNFLLPEYFEVKKDFPAMLDNKLFSIYGYKNIFRIHAKKAFYHIIGGLIFRGRKIIVDNETPVSDVLKLLKNNYLYKGFFYSEGYFEDFKDEIRTLYKIKKKHADSFENIQKQIGVSKKKVVVHIRRGDYVDMDISLPISYYKKVIEIINNSEIEYIFISDDPSYIKAEFEYLTNKYISSHNEIIDLQFLINADICVLSPSSFSWWGAWLNNNQNKQVYAPKYWLGFKQEKEFPTGISDHLNINWIQV